MKIIVDELQNKGHIIRTAEAEPSRVLSSRIPMAQFRDPIRTSIDAQLTQNDIYVKGTVQTTVHYTCSRCLKDFSKQFQSSFQQTFSADQEEIDLSGDIRETLLIDLPIKPLCRPDCKVQGVVTEDFDKSHLEDSRMEQAFNKLRFKS